MYNTYPVPFFSFGPMHAPIRAEILDVVQTCYDSHWYILGRKVEQFEADFATWNGVKHAMGVASGLDALRIALKAVGAGASSPLPGNWRKPVLASPFIRVCPLITRNR